MQFDYTTRPMLRTCSQLMCIISAFLLSGCTLAPTKKIERIATQAGFSKTVYASETHNLIAYSRLPLATTSKNNSTSNIPTAHVYLEGDGRPWTRGNTPAKNPNTTSPLALKLAIADQQATIYLNRPCYGFDLLPDNCDSDLWTSGRYNQAVIDSLNQALDKIKSQHHIKQFALIGYSGGGSLAALLANMRTDVTQLVTIAANLDHVAWTQHFGYEPLEKSLNAADLFPLPAHIKRFHLIGMQDTDVPPQTQLPAAKKDLGAEIITLEDFDHRCCWEAYWGTVLEKLLLRPL